MAWSLNGVSGLGFEPRQWQEICFPSLKRPDWCWGPLRLLCNRYRGSFQKVKRPGRELNHSPPSTAEVKNKRSYASAPPVCLHGVDMKDFTF